MRDILQAARGHPAAGLLVDDRPRRQIVRQIPPVRSGFHDIAQAVVDLAQIVAPVTGLFRQLRQIGCDERPFFVLDVGGVGLASA